MLSPVRLTSVVCLSVCNAPAPYSGGYNFPQYFYGFWYRGHPLTSMKNFTEIVPWEPRHRGELNTRGVAKYSDFGPIEGYIYRVAPQRRDHGLLWWHFITACTVVQAVVKANSQSNCNGQISNPRGSKTPERISMKLGIYIYVGGVTKHTNPHGAAMTWVVSANTWLVTCFGFLVYLFVLFTARRNAHIASSYGNSVRPSVCLSIRPSVTRWYCVKTTAHSPVQFALSNSKMCLVLQKPKKNFPQGWPLPPEILAPIDLPSIDSSESWHILPCSASTVRDTKGSSITFNKNSTRAFQRAIHQGSTPPLTSSKWG